MHEHVQSGLTVSSIIQHNEGIIFQRQGRNWPHDRGHGRLKHIMFFYFLDLALETALPVQRWTFPSIRSTPVRRSSARPALHGCFWSGLYITGIEFTRTRRGVWEYMRMARTHTYTCVLYKFVCVQPQSSSPYLQQFGPKHFGDSSFQLLFGHVIWKHRRGRQGQAWLLWPVQWVGGFTGHPWTLAGRRKSPFRWGRLGNGQGILQGSYLRSLSSLVESDGKLAWSTTANSRPSPRRTG